MDKNVVLSIRGEQTTEDEAPEVVELVTEGILTRGGEAQYTLRYEESELTGLEGTRTTIQVQPECVTILREGQVNSQMIFEEGRRHLSMYDTPYGALALGVNTRRMKVELGEGGGDIEIDYAIEIDHAVAGEHIFRIHVKERESRVLPQ